MVNNNWRTIVGEDANHAYDAVDIRATHDDVLALYVERAGMRGPGGVRRPGFDYRWAIYMLGSLLGEGFTDSAMAARSAAVQEAERVMYNLRVLVRDHLDIRTRGKREILTEIKTT
jgi:hypothetical protein